MFNGYKCKICTFYAKKIHFGHLTNKNADFTPWCIENVKFGSQLGTKPIYCHKNGDAKQIFNMVWTEGKTLVQGLGRTAISTKNCEQRSIPTALLNAITGNSNIERLGYSSV